MAHADLAKLSLNKGRARHGRAARRQRKWIRWGTGGAVVVLHSDRCVGVAQRQCARRSELGTVTTAFPTQPIRCLTPPDVVVAAAGGGFDQGNRPTGISGVQEGSVVKGWSGCWRDWRALDVSATRDQARAGCRRRKANLEQGKAELTDADANYRRTRTCFRKISSPRSAGHRPGTVGSRPRQHGEPERSDWRRRRANPLGNGIGRTNDPRPHSTAWC